MEYYSNSLRSWIQTEAYVGTDSITFSIDSSAPTVSLTSSDNDNLVSPSQVVTVTAAFSGGYGW